jgi:integrase/recombinase XerC
MKSALDNGSFTQQLRSLSERLGRPPSCPRSWFYTPARHSFATDLLDRTGNLKLVMDVLGHESVTTTQKYLHPALKNIAEIVNQRNAGREAEAAA